MNSILLRALVALVPASALFAYSVFAFKRSTIIPSVLRLIGAGGFVIVVLAHICEAMNVFPGMGWGLEHSLGHYVDLTSAVLGTILFPAGILLNRFSKPQAAKNTRIPGG